MKNAPLCSIRSAACLGVIVAVVATASAGPYTSAGGANPISPSAGAIDPVFFPGKEYSHNTDMDDQAVGDPEQNLAWDGTGGIGDTFDYSGSRPNDGDGQVDALANRRDALFWDVVADEVPLAFSIEQNECQPLHATGPESIYYEDPTWAGGVSGVWAVPAQVDQHAGGVVDPFDVDGLEVWGPVDENEEDPINDGLTGGLDGPQYDDSTRYSLVGDPVDPVGGTRVSVWAYNPVTQQSAPWISEAALSAVVQGLFGEEFTPEQEEKFDLDAMMTWDDVNPGLIDPGLDAILFSLRPINGIIDGGEIIFWDFQNPAQYLFHGGHLWDRPNDVMIGLHDLETPGNWNFDANVDAIEALPEPTTLALLAMGGIAALRRRRR